jgi:multidrug transporter EmrE-like cation transporter
MSLLEILALSLSEIIGDFAFKEFANNGGLAPLLIGVGGYLLVMCFLIISLQGSTILMVNGAWDGMSALIESLAAYIFLGERFHNYLQYIGLCSIIVGIFLLKIPLNRKYPFRIPNMKSSRVKTPH